LSSLSFISSMRKKNKTISDTTVCLEGVELKDNLIKGVKILGIKSKNGRTYPLEVMQKSLHMYENAIVALDHVQHDKPRSVTDIFGRIKNPRMTKDGIVGDLEYNNQHPYAKAFEYFVDNDPAAVGLSHEAVARTKMDYKTGEEIVEDIVEVEAVSLVANPATNPKGLFESYNKIMETVMKKSERNAKFQEVKLEEATLVEPGARVNVPESDDQDADDKKAMEGKEYDTYEAYMADMKEAVKKCMGSDMDEEAKCEAIVSMFAPKDLDVKAEEFSDKEIAVMDAKESVESKKDAETFIRNSSRVGFKLLLEELDSYRIRDEQAKLNVKILSFCKNSGLRENLVTEAFIDVLASVSEDKWKKLVEDRKSIATSKAPMSFAAEQISGSDKLTVDNLMKALRS